MLRMTTAVVLVCLGSQASGEGCSDHEGVRLFTSGPCGEVMRILEGEAPNVAAVGAEGLVWHFAAQGMAWGFILGFDTARGGLNQGSVSTLARLREECAAAPEKTAFEILDSF